MGDPYRKVRPGDRLPAIPHQLLNAAIDAGRAVREQSQSQQSAPFGPRYDRNVVDVRNDTGVNLDRFRVIGLYGPLTSPTDNLDAYTDQEAYVGRVPYADDDAGVADVCAVLLDGLPAGAIGPAVITGRTAVRLKVNNPRDTHASPDYGTSDDLTTGPTGSAVIILRDRMWWYTGVTGVVDNGSGLCRVSVGAGSEVSSLAILTAGAGGKDGTFPNQSFTGGGGTGATFWYTVAGGKMVAVGLITAGSGYTSEPTPVLLGASFTTLPTVSVTLLPLTLATGAVVDIEGVQGANEADGTWTITASGGSLDLQASAFSNAYEGAILSIAISTTGSGGTNGTFTDGAFTGGGGSGATFDYTVAGGILTSVTQTAGGSNYQSSSTPVFPQGHFAVPPTLAITVGSGTINLRSVAITNVTGTKSGTSGTEGDTVTVTAPLHHLRTGDWVHLTGIGGLTSLNDEWQVTVVDADTVTLRGVIYDDSPQVIVDDAGETVTDSNGDMLSTIGTYTGGGNLARVCWARVILNAGGSGGGGESGYTGNLFVWSDNTTCTGSGLAGGRVVNIVDGDITEVQ
jgi:hypothetical protein